MRFRHSGVPGRGSPPAIFLCRVTTVLLLCTLLSACNRTPGPDAPSEALEDALGDTATGHAVKHLDPRYVCPMHPQIVRDEPGNCPICGMDLVARSLEPDTGGRPVVTVRGEVLQSMGVRTGRVEKGTLWQFIRTVGRVDYDETRMAHVHPRAEGWMERVSLRAEGDHVRRDQLLGDLYSPEILSAQVDFLIALERDGKAATEARIEKARNRLRLLGVTEATIQRIEKRMETQNTVPVTSPQAGVVTMLGVRDGMFVTPQKEIVTIADLSRVWVLVDVFEFQIDWLREGLETEITVPAYPGREWEGKVDYIYPDLDPKSRTLRVRLAFENPQELLKANMFAEVIIYGGPRRDVLVIPREAIIVTGERESVVKALGEGRFEPVDVITGMREGGNVEVLQGLAEGDEVVISGQ
ncbi:MAG: efflux RND transporter periplasmic adaptor subunit, partial [Pseudomonadota bacterium]|nr:efflux RND transporter periplasmic adaptor subunit [Pseudomonadota bacterium]